MLLLLGKINPGYQRLLLVSICAVLYCLWIYWMPLTEIDETRFCEATREMMSSRALYYSHLQQRTTLSETDSLLLDPGGCRPSFWSN